MATPQIEVIENAYEGQKAYKQVFADVSDFAQACRDAGVNFSRDEWRGTVSTAQALDMCSTGDLSNVKRAQDIIDKVNASGIEFGRKQWERGMAGAFPMVPAFLAGEPESMMHMQESDSEQTPIRLFVSTVSSGGVENRELQNRAAAILALVMLLTEVRPTELWIYGELDAYAYAKNLSLPMIRVNTAPLDLSVASYMLAHQGFTRGLMHGYATRAMGFQGSWAFGLGKDEKKRAKVIGSILGATESDIVLGGVYINDAAAHRPLEWLQGQVDSLKQNLAEAA